MRLLVLLAALLWPVYSAQAAPICPATWDKTFQGATRTFMPMRLKGDWKISKAQAFTESSCRPTVCSRAGACGLLQIMKAAWKQVTGKERGQSVFDPKMNIIVSVKYMAWQCKQWLGRPRSAREVRELCLAAYNAGLKWILEAQVLCGMKRTWDEIKPCLHKVTGVHSRETINYVERTFRWRRRLGR